MSVRPPPTARVDHDLAPLFSQGPRALRRSWLLATTVGETLGFTVPVLVVLLALDLPPLAFLAVTVAAGAGEGLLLGSAQAFVLGREFLGFSRLRWVVATAAGASFAWLVGMLPSTFYDTWRDWPVALSVSLGVVLGLLLLCSIGTAQWVVLRHHVERAGWWVVGNAVAWLLGLGVLLAVVMPLWHEGQPPALVAGIGVAGGLAMALAVAWTTGLVLARLVRPHRPGGRKGGRPPDTVPRDEWTALGEPTDGFRVFDPSLVEALPEPVQRWLLHSIVPGTSLLTAVEVDSIGQIRLGRSWHGFRARQRSSLRGGLVWAASTRVLGLPLNGFDRWTHGTGEMRWRLLHRLRVMSADDVTVTRSGAGRHAAELLVMLPAVALDPSVRWEAVDDVRAKAHLRVGDDDQSVTVTVGPTGPLRQVELLRWGTPPGSGYGLHRFGAVLDDERLIDGYRVPTTVTAGWHFGTGRWNDGRFLRYQVVRCSFR